MGVRGIRVWGFWPFEFQSLGVGRRVWSYDSVSGSGAVGSGFRDSTAGFGFRVDEATLTGNKRDRVT